MITRSKQTVTVSRQGNHPKSHHGSTTNLNRRSKGAPVPVVWPAGFNPPALLLAQHAHHPLPPGVRKIVNPVTVNALTAALNMRAHSQPPPAPPSPGCTWSAPGMKCCSCCYCCCDSPEKLIPTRHISNHNNHSSNDHILLKNNNASHHYMIERGGSGSGGSGGSTNNHNEKTRRRRSRSRDKQIKKLSVNIDMRKLINRDPNDIGNNANKPKFIPVTTLEDTQAIRCAEFHPRGHMYAVGSNSKSLRICAYPSVSHLSEDQAPQAPNILFKRNKHHRGSIYCLGWSPDGSLLATGSNDKTIKLTRFEDLNRHDQLSHSQEVELSMHDGTVRDICFIEDLSNKSSLIVSGGAGDCKIYVTDCVTATPFQALTGHSAPILSLYNWGGVMFCSGSQDKTIRIWDLRSRGCVNMISPLTSPNSATVKSPVGSVCVDPTGRLLISGHEDSAIVLYDIRGNRQIQAIKPHSADVRSVRFSPNAYYLLSAGYDQTLMLTDLQGDLSLNLNSVPVASHDDKIISGRWHPTEFSFLSTSADKTATLWALPSM